MRPAEFAESEILEAGKKVEAVGKRVTDYAVCRELGGGDQKRLLSVWNSHFEQGAVEPAQLYEPPVEMEDVLNRLTGELGAQVRATAVRLNTHAVKAAERQVAETTRKYRELKELNEAEQKDASLIITELEEQLQATTAAERENTKKYFIDYRFLAVVAYWGYQFVEVIYHYSQSGRRLMVLS